MTGPQIRLAATVIVLRDSARGPEIFMVRRHEGTAFMGGAYVFPGGRVDRADVEAAAGDQPLAFKYAALRELFEEAGVLLARGIDGEFVQLSGETHDRFTRYRVEVHHGDLTLADIAAKEAVQLAPDALVPFANWVTPPLDTRRFDTHFFITRVPPVQVPAHDTTETVHSLWITATEALARAARDEILLPVPTWTTLRELEPFATVDEAIAWAQQRPIARREPLFREEHGERMLLLPGDPMNPEHWPEPLRSETRFVHIDGRWKARVADRGDR
jgi:8-oxo-dGTP pyrophosphatase MutT (NUDIX family)